MKQIAVYTPY